MIDSARAQIQIELPAIRVVRIEKHAVTVELPGRQRKVLGKGDKLRVIVDADLAHVEQTQASARVEPASSCSPGLRPATASPTVPW